MDLKIDKSIVSRMSIDLLRLIPELVKQVCDTCHVSLTVVLLEMHTGMYTHINNNTHTVFLNAREQAHVLTRSYLLHEWKWEMCVVFVSLGYQFVETSGVTLDEVVVLATCGGGAMIREAREGTRYTFGRDIAMFHTPQVSAVVGAVLSIVEHGGEVEQPSWNAIDPYAGRKDEL